MCRFRGRRGALCTSKAAAAADARGESRPQRQEASRSRKASRRPGVADARSMSRGRGHEQDDHRGSQSPRSRNSVAGGDGAAAARSAGVRLTQPPVAIVQQEGRTFMPVPAYIDEPLPEEMPDSALAWDGERYSREEFCEYYGDEVLFYQAQQLTYFCRQYLSTWFDYSRHTALHLVLRLLKRQELRDNLALGDILLRYWYRAMVLRAEYLGAGPDGHLCTDAECQAMDRMVLQWAVDYDSGERPAMKARQLQRLYWQKWFGHKTLALTLAQHGVRHWMRTHLALHTVAQVHDSDAFRAAVARPRGEYTAYHGRDWGLASPTFLMSLRQLQSTVLIRSGCARDCLPPCRFSAAGARGTHPSNSDLVSFYISAICFGMRRKIKCGCSVFRAHRLI